MTRAEAKRIKRAMTLEELHALADAVLSRARRSAARHAPSRKEREGKRAAKRDEAARLRAYAFARWGGRCLICMGLLEQGWHLHHIVGAGLRRSRQTERNTVPLCAHDHRQVHANDIQALLALRAWAEANADEFTKAELERRILKVSEARATRRTA